MKLIHINESAYSRLLEGNDRRPPFKDFYDDIMAFVRDMFKDPISAIPNDYGIITKDERIDEPYDETTGLQQSRYYVRYDWTDDVRSSMKDSNRMSNPLKDKIRKFYNRYFNIVE